MDPIHYGAYLIVPDALGCHVYHMGEHVSWFPNVAKAQTQIDGWNNAR